ncbi:hypothetical protein RH831_05275 [Halodesulfurarchaeum sp. HSR-GB]|uniref:DUF7537 family lipoprotein n=1 Tax=Halodesulfurarchaeum sp. HSR-GB TaxID=3074077 RepID=UPI00286482E5|nr:hypothetical protein [Halodesulfurarchaeum sp. HSR-GB]MDR5656590.1 hypothetical protein [Halodesulfurarchaeum sp. HSR-GB]
MQRRRFIASSVAVGLSLLAGCSDNQEPSDGTTTTPETTTTDELDESDGDETDAVQFGNVYKLEADYAVDIQYDDPERGLTGSATARFEGDDYYQRIEDTSTGDVYEVYHVDGTDYVVINGETCIKNPGASVEPEESDVDTEADTYAEKPDADLTAKGTTTIDGETVYVFEVTGEDVEGTLTIYVSQATGYLRRVESDWGRLDFHSWGDVEPITAPDMECQDFSG